MSIGFYFCFVIDRCNQMLVNIAKRFQAEKWLFKNNLKIYMDLGDIFNNTF